VVPPDSDRVSRVPSYSGSAWRTQVFVYRAVTVYGRVFHRVRLTILLPCWRPTTPMHRSTWVWAGPLSLATTEGVAFAFLSWSYLDVSVHSVGSACAVTAHEGGRVAPFGHLRIKAQSAAPRSFSQLSRVLHRLSMPRHPPKALTSLTCFSLLFSRLFRTQTSSAAVTASFLVRADFRLSVIDFSKNQGPHATEAAEAE